MDIVNIDALIAQGRILDLANVNQDEDYLVIGKYSNDYTTNSFKYTNYPVLAIKAKDLIAVTTDGTTITGDGTPGSPLQCTPVSAGVQTVTGLNTNNVDPLNPVVQISVDNVTITGQGTPATPLSAIFQPVSVDGTSITGDGSILNPLVATINSLQQVLNFNHDLVNGNNFQGTGAGALGSGATQVIAIGEDAAKNNGPAASFLVAIGTGAGLNNTGGEGVFLGVGAGIDNTGANVVALNSNAANTNSGDDVIAIGRDAATNNTKSKLIAVGVGSGVGNDGDDVIGIGINAANNNLAGADYVIAVGSGAAQNNEGSLVTALGTAAATANKKSNVIALGTQAGLNNNRAQSVIISNSELPTFADYTAATDPLSLVSITVANGATTGTYLFHNQATNSIGAVRIP